MTTRQWDGDMGQHLTSERLVKRQWRMSHRFRPMPTRILVEPAPALIPAEQMDEVAPEELETAEAVKAVAALEELETAEAIEAVAALEAVAATTAREVAWARTYLGLDHTSPDEGKADVARR